jgi:ferredoxin
MQIDHGKCVACGNCIPICPMGAIYIDPAVNRATVNQDECVECFTCHRGMSKSTEPRSSAPSVASEAASHPVRPRADVCPTDALPTGAHLARIVRRAFSDLLVPHESTGVHGRGTEEVTNDVTGRVQEGEAGFTIEFGHPGRGPVPGHPEDDHGPAPCP